MEGDRFHSSWGSTAWSHSKGEDHEHAPSTLIIAKMTTDSANITIAVKYEVQYGLSISVLIDLILTYSV